MMIAWYQPTDGLNTKSLIHFCHDDGKSTLCGKELNHKWIIAAIDDVGVVCSNDCKKCVVKEQKEHGKE